MKRFYVSHLEGWHHQPETETSRARVLLVHGLSEHSGRHLGTANALLKAGFEVVRFDLRGSGKSGGKRQWITSFDDYVVDCTKVVKHIRSEMPTLPLFLMGHSLGGAIALHTAAAHSGVFAGLIASSPAFRTGNSLPTWKIKLGRVILKYAPGFRMPSSRDKSYLSRDPAVIEQFIGDPLVTQFNTVQQGAAILDALENLPSLCASIRIPTLLLHGSHDKLIRAEGSFHLFQALVKSRRDFVVIPGGYHELHNDLEKEDYWQTITTWLNRILAIGYCPPK